MMELPPEVQLEIERMMYPDEEADPGLTRRAAQAIQRQREGSDVAGGDGRVNEVDLESSDEAAVGRIYHAEQEQQVGGIVGKEKEPEESLKIEVAQPEVNDVPEVAPEGWTLLETDSRDDDLSVTKEKSPDSFEELNLSCGLGVIKEEVSQEDPEVDVPAGEYSDPKIETQEPGVEPDLVVPPPVAIYHFELKAVDVGTEDKKTEVPQESPEQGKDSNGGEISAASSVSGDSKSGKEGLTLAPRHSDLATHPRKWLLRTFIACLGQGFCSPLQNLKMLEDFLKFRFEQELWWLKQDYCPKGSSNSRRHEEDPNDHSAHEFRVILRAISPDGTVLEGMGDSISDVLANEVAAQNLCCTIRQKLKIALADSDVADALKRRKDAVPALTKLCSENNLRWNDTKKIHADHSDAKINRSYEVTYKIGPKRTSGYSYCQELARMEAATNMLRLRFGQKNWPQLEVLSGVNCLNEGKETSKYYQQVFCRPLDLQYVPLPRNEFIPPSLKKFIKDEDSAEISSVQKEVTAEKEEGSSGITKGASEITKGSNKPEVTTPSGLKSPEEDAVDGSATKPKTSEFLPADPGRLMQDLYARMILYKPWLCFGGVVVGAYVLFLLGYFFLN